LMRLNGEGPRVTFICALTGLKARGSEASAAAAVPAMERLRRLERGTTTWVGGIPKNYATFCVSVEALPTFTRPLDNPLRNQNNRPCNGALTNTRRSHRPQSSIRIQPHHSTATGTIARASTVTFRKVVTPWLPFRRPGLRVAPGADRALLLACLSTLLPVDSSNGWLRSSALD
jgi:hypothetical protein